MPACASTNTHTQVYLAMTLYMNILVCTYAFVSVNVCMSVCALLDIWSKLCNVVVVGHLVSRADQRYVVSVESIPVKGSRRAGEKKRDACVHVNWSVQ